MSWYWSDRTDNGKIEGVWNVADQASPLTISIWANWLTNDSNNDDNMIQIADNALSADVIRMGLRDGTDDNLNMYFGSGNAFTTATLTAGTWHHCLLNWNAGSSFDIYLDGPTQTAHDSWGDIAFETLDVITIGREGDFSDSDSWQGRLAEVAVWDANVTDEEIALLAAGYSPLLIPRLLPNLICYEPLNSPVLNRYLIHPDAPTLAAGSGGPTTGEGTGTAPVYDPDHPRIIQPSSQEIISPTKFPSVRQAILDGLDSDKSDVAGWDALVKNIDVSNVTRVSDTRVTVDLPALPTYDIAALETITATVPNEALQISTSDIVGDPTFTVDVGSGGETIQVGLVTETDLAQSVTVSPGAVTVTTGQTTETDLSQPVTIVSPITITTGQALETDLSQPVTVGIGAVSIIVGQALETDLSQPVTGIVDQSITINQAIETDLAQPVTIASPITITVGQVLETDVSQPVTVGIGVVGISAGQALETDISQPVTLTSPITITVGQALEIDLAQSVTIVQVIQTQDQFRFGADDGSESLHTWLAAQNVNITQSASTPAILRIQVNNSGDFPSQQMVLQVKKTTDPDSAYRDVPVAA